ncbi:transmembrane protein 14C [Rhodnius prolixus]|uniref:Putative transmembrane protein 14c n=1 Tax=Rhodnius prolixus TaxID=13249 RepID=R4G7R9_RHOPR
MAIDHYGIMYAVLVGSGGAYGYMKSGSVPSLAAGLIFGTLLGVGAFQVSRNADNYQLSLGTSALLGGLMGYRYYNSGKIMPAGLLAGISVAMAVRYGSMAFFSNKEFKTENIKN